MRRRRLMTAFLTISISVFLLVTLGRAWATATPRLIAVPPSAGPEGIASATAEAAEPTVPATALPREPAPSRAGSDRPEQWVEVDLPSPATTAVANAHAAGAPRASRLAVAVLDLRSGRLYGAGDIDAEFPSASLVKVFIAARLLAEGRANDPAVQDGMWRMIACSDDDAGSWLYGLAGGDGLASWVAHHYGISGVGPPSMPGWWGFTRITARGMVDFYAQVADDPAVGPWLRGAMGSTQPYGCDGFYQHFGLPSAARSWQVKQGWMCCGASLSRMHSTGFVDDRYAVALLAEGPSWTYGGHGAETLTVVAQTLLPGGTLPRAKT